MSLDRLEAVLRDAVECRCRPKMDDIDAQNILFALDGLRQQLAAKDAEIDRLRSIESIAREYGIIGFVDIEQIHNQLEASQAREQQYREALENILRHPEYAAGCAYYARNALALPQDATALEAIVQRAGEVMRERCAQEAWNREPEFNGPLETEIRILPGVTMDDLK